MTGDERRNPAVETWTCDLTSATNGQSRSRPRHGYARDAATRYRPTLMQKLRLQGGGRIPYRVIPDTSTMHAPVFTLGVPVADGVRRPPAPTQTVHAP